MDKQTLATLRRAIINEVINIEGGYVNNPKDSGGATYCGITQAVARKHGFPDVRQLSKDQVYQIYETDYWDDISGNEMASRNRGLAYELFDTAVNMGESRAGGFLQRALNVLNRNGRDYADLKLDHHIGAKTLAALDAYIGKRGQTGLVRLVRMLDDLQSAFFIELAERRPKDEEFIYGWQSHRVGVMFVHKGAEVPEEAKVAPIQQPSPTPTATEANNSHNNSHLTEETAMHTDMTAGYQQPPDGFVTDETTGEKIPYWNNQVSAFEKSPDTGFAAWLKQQAVLIRKTRSKSGWKSKIMWGAGGLISTGISVATARWGFDVDPDVLLGVATVAMTGGGGFIAIARKWFTKKFLS